MSDDLLKEAQDAFDAAREAENENRVAALDDLRFARLGEQWPEEIKAQRAIDNRPMLTINRLPTFIRQVVNEARQMKPTIKVHPADSEADVETAEIINGLIRNIEYTSNADVAYDTATESAVTMGWGYFTVDIDYAYDDTFDLDILIKRVANPFSIYGDPNSIEADSFDWNTAFETEWLATDDFKRQFPGADEIDWECDEQSSEWFSRERVLIAKYWRRTQEAKKILQLSDGRVMDASSFDEAAPFLMVENISVVGEREVMAHKVKRYLLNGKEVLKEEEWPGKYIPIIPVYGDEVNEEGKRHFLSLVRSSKDAQRMYNYWRSTATELVALAPKVPFIGPKGSFKSDARNWATSNTASHPYLEYDPVPGAQPPQRQPLDTGAAAGALQEAMNAADDLKAIMGIFDPSMGARSNETSGKAIIARERQGDVTNFHFQDNMSRAIRHAGRIIIDLIPKVYNSERIVRTLGEDGSPTLAKLKQPVPQMDPQGRPVMEPVLDPMGNPVMDPMSGAPIEQPKMRVFDLGIGKYDLTVTAGPSYGTQRQEAASQMIEMMRMNPGVAPLIGDLVAKNLDWPGADEIARRLKAMLPPQLQEGGLPPEVEQMIEEGKQTIAGQQQMIEQMQAYILKLESEDQAKADKVKVDAFNAETKRLDAETKRMDVLADMGHSPTQVSFPYADQIVAEAKANSLNAKAEHEMANANLANARAMQVATPDPIVPQSIIHAHRPPRDF